MLRDTVRRLFGQAWTDGVRHFDLALWNQVAEIGLPGLLVPESGGGAGGQWRDAQVVMAAMGQFATPLPLAETMLAARLIFEAGWPIPEGPLGLSTQAKGQLEKRRGTWQFTGTLAGIPWGDSAATLVASVTAPGEEKIIVVDQLEAHAVTTRANLAGEARARLVFEDAPVRVYEGLVPLLEQAALMRIAQIAGALDAMLVRSVDYARNRRQFGKSIGQFQSVQHSLAIMAEESAAVGAACTGAFLAADHGNATFEVAAAKLRANEAIGVCAAIAHQVHGAIGFTREFDLRQYTQRLVSWRTEYGNDRYWAEKLGRAVAAHGPLHFWADLTHRSDAMSATTEQALNKT
jgi:acyl-CoA dehydrogenase